MRLSTIKCNLLEGVLSDNTQQSMVEKSFSDLCETMGCENS